jgi:xanthine dehydrogenase YagT iron-sulfur-binding subunit
MLNLCIAARFIYMKEEKEKIILTKEEKELFKTTLPEDFEEIVKTGMQRRHFLKLMTVMGSGMFALDFLGIQRVIAKPFNESTAYAGGLTENIQNGVEVAFDLNGKRRPLVVDSRMTLLDALRERLGLTGSKKGCDHGQCGACTVIVDNRRILSCLTLAATCESKTVTTIEGLAQRGELHPIQSAFILHDGFQCGYCTPGQICSAAALMDEIKNGEASYVTANVQEISNNLQLSKEEIRERMSGNICRCGAYPNIVAAILAVHSGKNHGSNVAELM